MPESVKVESKTNKEVRSGKEEDKNELVSCSFCYRIIIKKTFSTVENTKSKRERI